MAFPRACLFFVISSALCFAAGKSYTPASDDEVVAKLPASSRFLQPLITQWNLAPEDPVRAAALASEYLRQYREDGDPRFLGRAQRAIQYWWDREDTSSNILALKGTILQSGHEFTPSLEVFSAALIKDPQNSSARLNRANVYWVLGRSDEALEDCQLLPKKKLLKQTCSALVSGARENPKEKAQTLLQEVSNLPTLTAGDKSWAEGVAGELYDWSGETEMAERVFLDAISGAPNDHYLRATLADLLLREEKPEEVLNLISDQTPIDALLLRRAIAQKRLGKPSPETEILQSRFAQELSGDKVLHWREQAIFQLEVMEDPQKALDYARRNWAVQREPVDALLLLKAAKASGSKEKPPLEEWFKTHPYTVPEAVSLWKAQGGSL